jgi:hypothetical protein
MNEMRAANNATALFVASTPAILGVVLLIGILALLGFSVVLGVFAFAGMAAVMLFGRWSALIVLVGMIVLGSDLFGWPRWPLFHSVSALFSSANAWTQTHPNFVTLMVDAMAHVALKYVWGGFWYLCGLIFFHLPVSAIIWLVHQFAELTFRMFGEAGFEGGCLVARAFLGDILLLPMALADIDDTKCRINDGGFFFILLDNILSVLSINFSYPSSGIYVYNAAHAFFFPFASAPAAIREADHFWPFACTLAFMGGALRMGLPIINHWSVMTNIIQTRNAHAGVTYSPGVAPFLALVLAKPIDGGRGLSMFLGFCLWLPLMAVWAFLIRPWVG